MLTEHLFMCLLLIYVLSWGKCLLKVTGPCLNWSAWGFFFPSSRNLFYVLDINFQSHVPKPVALSMMLCYAQMIKIKASFLSFGLCYQGHTHDSSSKPRGVRSQAWVFIEVSELSVFAVNSVCLCSTGRPLIPKPPTSASWIPGLQAYATTSVYFSVLFINLRVFHPIFFSKFLFEYTFCLHSVYLCSFNGTYNSIL